jgi:uncharacterized membrane protein
MRHFPKILATTAIAFTLLIGFSGVELSGQSDRAEAKSSSGGRSSGGSFSGGRSSGGSSGRSSGSSSGSSSGRSSGGSSSNSRPYRNDRTYYRDDYHPGYGYSSGYGNSGSSVGMWIGFILFLGIAGAIAYLIWKAQQSSGTGEANNDIVTVTQLQVALLSQEREIQERLSELTVNADMDTAEGRNEMLRESVLAILRSPENWSHVRSSSQMVKSREAAGTLFGQLSLTERSKVESETLVNAGGKVRQKKLQIIEDSDPGSYIIVTLLVGTENDQPLFSPIHTTDDLRAALQTLGAVSTDYLLILELLWNPQDSKESLTYDEMLTHYPDLVALA